MSALKTTVTVKFDFAHRLMNHASKCKNIHGHSGHAEITFRGHDRDKTSGFLGDADFGILKEGIRDWVDVYWDHALLLNSLDPLRKLIPDRETDPIEGIKIYATLGEPSSEYMAEHLHHKVHSICLERFTDTFNKTFWLERVKLYETESNCAEYTVTEW